MHLASIFHFSASLLLCLTTSNAFPYLRNEATHRLSGSLIPRNSNTDSNSLLRNSLSTMREIPTTKKYYFLSDNELDSMKPLVKLASIGYCQDFRNGFNCGRYCSDFQHFELNTYFHTNKYGVNGYVARDTVGKVIVVGFGGTMSLKNWIENLKLLRVDMPGTEDSQVHLGFWESYLEARPLVLEAVSSLLQQHPDHSILITGHSRGGAIASLCAMDLRASQSIPQEVSLATFGEPRLGDANFANHFDRLGILSKTFINKRDPVPHVPTLLSGWRRHGVEVWIREDEQAVQCLMNEDPNCSNSETFFNISDHNAYFNVGFGCSVGAESFELNDLIQTIL
ncbi:uncharacterized protein VTP21DRAFT_5631 [Calcarisporiella thermophila]|uniref:uncharacterized protein n=1 Tax=Calcarisporiella thermophila TaxID=911321 RepID=UPI00374390BB